MALTSAQKSRILEAFLAMDPNALTDTGFLTPDWDHFFYEGQVTLDGLCRLAAMVTVMLLDETPP